VTISGFDWRLSSGIASLGNSCVLLLVLGCFPLVIRWSGAPSLPEMSPQDAQHTYVYVKACLSLTAFLWICFGIAVSGMRRRGVVRWRDLVGAKWNRWQAVAIDIGIACATLVVMGVIGSASNALLGPLQQETPVFRAIVSPQNSLEALAFLASALTAGFVEEFVFRGYLQRQCQALLGNAILASALQVIIFTAGHIYQGWTRLIPVLLIGIVLTVVALWRKSLLPGMMAHGAGDGLVAFLFFAKHL